MSGVTIVRLVAGRELRERSRQKSLTHFNRELPLLSELFRQAVAA